MIRHHRNLRPSEDLFVQMREATDAIRQARREASLATRLLSAAPLRPPAPAEPVPVPSSIFPQDSANGLRWAVEHITIDGITMSATFSGWAFTHATPDIQAVRITLALEAGARWFVVSGKLIDRPDVSTAFPPATGACPHCSQCGFLFEFTTRNLPCTIQNYRILLVGATGDATATPIIPIT